MRDLTYAATLSSVVDLVPVVCLVPKGPDIPPLPTEYSEESSTWWRRAWRTAVGLDPDRPVDGLLALDEIVTERLMDALVDYVSECGAKYGWSPFLDGGFVLVVDRKVYSRPTCCVDLEEGVRDWLLLGETWSEQWQPVESGHPGVLARLRNGSVHVSAQADDFPEEIVPAVVVPVERIRSAAEQGLIAIHEFALRLERRLAERGIEPSGRLARVVSGLEAADA